MELAIITELTIEVEEKTFYFKAKTDNINREISIYEVIMFIETIDKFIGI